MRPNNHNYGDGGTVLIAVLSFFFFIGFPLFVIGGILGWFRPAPGKILMTIGSSIETSDFYEYKEQNGKPYITIQDKEYSMYEDDFLKDLNGNLSFLASNYQRTPSEIDWEMEIQNGSSAPQKYKRSSIPAGIEYHIFEPNFSLGYGENKIKVTAKNNKGTETFELVVIKINVKEECAKSENADVSICKSVKASKEAYEKKKTENSSNLSSSSNKTSSGSGTSINKKGCVHYEYGKCWDDLEDRAYENGYRDAMNGGHAYYDPDCTGHCEDIYEDAYYEGYENGQYGL